MEAFYGILIPFLGTSLGAACVFFMKKSLSDAVQRSLTGFAAGVMVAASVWSLLIPAIEQSSAMGKLSFLPAFLGFWVGILFLLLLDHVVPHLHTDDFAHEHRVAAQFQLLHYLARQIRRTFGNRGGIIHVQRGHGRKVALLPLVHVAPRPDAAEIQRLAMGFIHQIHHKLAAPRNQVMAEAIAAYRNGHHRRFAVDRADPRDSNDVGLGIRFRRTAANHHRRNGRKQIAGVKGAEISHFFFLHFSRKYAMIPLTFF